jgi:phosphate/sulfate permease
MRAIVGVVLFAAVVASIALALGLQHNTQSEFVDESGQLDVFYCAQIFFSWFFMALLAGAALAWSVLRLRRWVSSRPSQSS